MYIEQEIERETVSQCGGAERPLLYTHVYTLPRLYIFKIVKDEREQQQLWKKYASVVLERERERKKAT